VAVSPKLLSRRDDGRSYGLHGFMIDAVIVGLVAIQVLSGHDCRIGNGNVDNINGLSPRNE
jgi:hypothetical protein